MGVVSTSHYSAPMGGLDTTTSTAADAASAAALAFSPRDPNRFLVGGSSDRVMHASRLGNPPTPKAYRPARRRLGCSLAASGVGAMGKKMDEQGGEEQEGAMGGVTCLAFSPFFQRYFLAGCGDGSIRLYKVRGVETGRGGGVIRLRARPRGAENQGIRCYLVRVIWRQYNCRFPNFRAFLTLTKSDDPL